MAYTPELSYRGSATLRRLAWLRGKPMTKTLEALLEATGRLVNHDCLQLWGDLVVGGLCFAIA